MLLVVGGQSRNVGKTSVAAGIVRRLRSAKWAALKITQYGHGSCSREDHACECAPENGQLIDLSEEYEPSQTDSGRLLAAGAHRSFWLRAPSGHVHEAADLIRKIIDQHENTIVESNSILDSFDPDVYLQVLDFGCEDFKASAARYLDRADAFIIVDRGIESHLWPEVARGWLDGKPHFLVKPPAYLTAEVVEFVRSRLFVPR